MNNFNKDQKERLEVQGRLEFWAREWNKRDHPKLKMEIDTAVKVLVNEYESQRIRLDYHLSRYERHKRYYKR